MYYLAKYKFDGNLICTLDIFKIQSKPCCSNKLYGMLINHKVDLYTIKRICLIVKDEKHKLFRIQGTERNKKKSTR